MGRINGQQRGLAMQFSYWILLLLFYLLAASQAIQSFSYKWTTIAVHQQYSLQKTLDDEPPKPYVYRALMPHLVNFIVDSTPENYLEVLRNRSINTLRANIGDEVHLMGPKIVASYGVIIFLNFLLLVATLFVLRAMSRYVLSHERENGTEFLSDIAPVLFSLMLSLSYRVYNGFIYDHLEIFCLASYILLTIYRKSLLSMLLLVLAILNKETAVFFPLLGTTLLLAVGNMKLNRTQFRKFILETLVVLCGFVFIRYVFRDSSGGAVEFYASGNFDFWFSMAPWISITTPHLQLIPLPKPSNIIILIPIIFAIFFAWRQKPNIIRLPLTVSLFINLPLFFLFSYRDEFRNLSLTFPFIFLATVHTIYYFYFKKSPLETQQ
jgi:hypothetical protein